MGQPPPLTAVIPEGSVHFTGGSHQHTHYYGSVKGVGKDKGGRGSLEGGREGMGRRERGRKKGRRKGRRRGKWRQRRRWIRQINK